MMNILLVFGILVFIILASFILGPILFPEEGETKFSDRRKLTKDQWENKYLYGDITFIIYDDHGMRIDLDTYEHGRYMYRMDKLKMDHVWVNWNGNPVLNPRIYDYQKQIKEKELNEMLLKLYKSILDCIDPFKIELWKEYKVSDLKGYSSNELIVIEAQCTQQ